MGKVSLKLTATAKPKPSMWNMSADGKTKNANQAQWAAAWNAANKLANKRGSVQSYGLKCFTSALTLRAQTVCAACDNKNGTAFAKGVALNTDSAKDFYTNCSSFVYMLKEVTSAIKLSIAYANITVPSATLALALKNITDKTYDLTDCVGANPETAAVKVATKSAAKLPSVKITTPKVVAPKANLKVTVPKVSVPKVAVKASVAAPKIAAPKAKLGLSVKASSKRLLQAVVKPVVTPTAAPSTNGIEVDSWTAYQKSANMNPVTIKVTYSDKCAANPLMKDMLSNNMTAVDIKHLQELMGPVFKAASALYTECGNAVANKAWTGFVGTKNVFQTAATKNVAVKVSTPKAAVKVTTPKVSVSIPKISVPKVTAKVTVPKVAVKASVGTKRRLQAPVVTNDLTVSATGVKVETYKNTGMDIPKELAGDGQTIPAAAKLFGFATLLALAVSMFFN